MPRQTEPSANNALGGILRGTLPGSRVLSEYTQVIAGVRGRRPDILITAPGRSPVVVEAEYEPASTVEAEAKALLGLEVVEGRRPIEAVIALRYPEEVGAAADLPAALAVARLSYCVYTGDKHKPDRFPESGWLEGSVSDLADLVSLVSVPQRAVDEAAATLEQGIERAAAILNEMAALRSNITPAIARLLGMADVPQTRRMACAIIANAMVFHERIAGMHANVKPLRLVCGPSVLNPQEEVLSAWTHILSINYWAIFAIARDILEQLPSGDAALVLGELRDTAQRISATGVDNAHDLTGRIFQRLIADRKYLATFYTLPASAALLARLAVAKLRKAHSISMGASATGGGQDGGEIDWGDAGAIGKLRVGDFACGTGALLSAVYEQIAARHERAGGDAVSLHRVMMEEVLYGCDVMPSAVHITGSTLSGIQPSEDYGKSRLYTLAYGRQIDGSVAVGSLELLQSSATMTLFNTNDPAQRTGSAGQETATQIIADIPDAGFDLVIMNPPFTRATNHGGALANVVNPAVAAFNASASDQTAMGDRINRLGKGTCYHGNAGIASAFAALAHRKLKPGGVLALVLPLVAAAGLSWQDFRQMLAQHYTDLTVLSIAADDINGMSFSADTGLGECLVIARKMPAGPPHDRRGGFETRPYTRAHFTSLTRRPLGFAHASAIAKNIITCDYVRQIEDGPYGGTRLMVGDELAGEMLTAIGDRDGGVWGAVRLSDYSLAQTAYALSQSKLWLPGSPTAIGLKMDGLGSVGKLGLVHRDINGPPPRGPFDKVASSPTATYPALWNHDAKEETKIVCVPDSSLQVRPGMEAKAAEVWATASHAHLNLEVRFNSQPLAVAVTEQESMGGRAWPNVNFPDNRFDYAFALWCNSTLGLLSYWWHSSRQDSGRGQTTIRAIETLPVLDFRALREEQLATAQEIFEEFRDKELQPAYIADADPNRALLDRRVVCDLLGFDESAYRAVRRLCAKWCAEPSVHGGKKRPKGAALVV